VAGVGREGSCLDADFYITNWGGYSQGVEGDVSGGIKDISIGGVDCVGSGFPIAVQCAKVSVEPCSEMLQ